jgi:hypothetical protein
MRSLKAGAESGLECFNKIYLKHLCNISHPSLRDTFFLQEEEFKS